MAWVELFFYIEWTESMHDDVTEVPKAMFIVFGKVSSRCVKKQLDKGYPVKTQFYFVLGWSPLLTVL